MLVVEEYAGLAWDVPAAEAFVDQGSVVPVVVEYVVLV